MPISNNYLFTLLQLPGIGVTTANKIVRYSDSQEIEISSAIDLNDLIKACIDNKLISNKLQFSNSDINEAINKANNIIDKSNEADIHIISKYDKDYPQNLTIGSLNNNINKIL